MSGAQLNGNIPANPRHVVLAEQPGPVVKPAGRLGTVHRVILALNQIESKTGVPFKVIAPGIKGFAVSAPLALADRVSYLPAKLFQMLDKYILGNGPKECMTNDGPVTAGVTGLLAGVNALIRGVLLAISAVVSRGIFATVALTGYALELVAAAVMLGIAVGLAGIALVLFFIVNATGIPTLYLLYKQHESGKGAEAGRYSTPSIDDGSSQIPAQEAYGLDDSDAAQGHILIDNSAEANQARLERTLFKDLPNNGRDEDNTASVTTTAVAQKPGSNSNGQTHARSSDTKCRMETKRNTQQSRQDVGIPSLPERFNRADESSVGTNRPNHATAPATRQAANNANNVAATTGAATGDANHATAPKFKRVGNYTLPVVTDFYVDPVDTDEDE